MKRPLALLAIAVSLTAGVILRAADDLVLARFGDYLEALRTQAGIPGLAAVLVGTTDITWERGFGLQDIAQALPARTDTPFEIDGVTQALTATLVLRCVDDGSLSLDDPVARFSPSSPYAGATLRQIMSHTSAGPNGLVFSYRLDRLNALVGAVSLCTNLSFRASIEGLLKRLAMARSVPGTDVVLSPPADEFDDSTLARFASVFASLATPYAVDSNGNASQSRYSATTLTPGSGLISTARDLANFDLGFKTGYLLRPETLAIAWTPPLDGNGQRLPHALGWFGQTYNGERVVWQFGVSDGASSSLMIMVPRRALTLILLANSPGLVRPFSLTAGDVTASPFGKLFLGIFVR
jgi:CubicO group peptidase (beta-lactamase class C family)